MAIGVSYRIEQSMLPGVKCFRSDLRPQVLAARSWKRHCRKTQVGGGGSRWFPFIDQLLCEQF